MCTAEHNQSTCDLDITQSVNCVRMGNPCHTKPIKGDGNCLFRALSYAVSGSENHHRKIRTGVVKHLKGNGTEFDSFLRDGYTSVEEYIAKTRMQYVGTWATELEILAAADLLHTDIYIFQDKWVWFSSKELQKNRHVNGGVIYLKHCNQSHYEVVLCVKKSVVDSTLSVCTNEMCCNETNLPTIVNDTNRCNRKRRGNDLQVDCELQTSKTECGVNSKATNFRLHMETTYGFGDDGNIKCRGGKGQTRSDQLQRKTKMNKRQADNTQLNSNVDCVTKRRKLQREHYANNLQYREEKKEK